MIPNEPSTAVVSSVATKLSSPDCVIPEQKTSPIHGGGWIRPSETNGDHGDTNMGGRVRRLFVFLLIRYNIEISIRLLILFVIHCF